MRQCIKRFWGQSEGQALVEMAVITPILIFMLIGVFEVGWILRDYLILVATSREAARFAARPYVLDIESQDIGFETVYTHAINSISNQIPYTRAVLIVSVVSIDAGNPCGGGICDCLAVRTNPISPTTIRQPNMLSYTRYITKFPYSSTEESLINFDAMAQRMAEDSRQFNCELFAKTEGTAALRKIDSVTVEIFFEHHQLFGFPLISNPYTDPLVLYTSTTMRILDARQP